MKNTDNSVIQPGTFRLAEMGEIPKQVFKERPKLEKSSILVGKVFPKLIKEYGFPNQVYYPCSGFDISPSSSFKDVIYLDAKAEVVGLLRAAGLKAYQADVRHFNPDRGIDLLILFNPCLNRKETENLAKRISPNFVLCNNYHNTEKYMKSVEGFTFEGNIEKLYSVFAKNK